MQYPGLPAIRSLTCIILPLSLQVFILVEGIVIRVLEAVHATVRGVGVWKAIE